MRADTMHGGGQSGRGSAARGRSQPHAYRSLPRADATGEAYPAWMLEDLEAPEAWSLASFVDLLPRELA